MTNINQNPTNSTQITILAHYATTHGVPVEAYLNAGWTATTYFKHTALAIPTANGTRYRLFDADRKYSNPRGFQRCWYRLDEAVQMATDTGSPLILANGEASAVAAQWHGLAAFAVAGGSEKTTLPPKMITSLKTALNGRLLLIALDCDTAGRTAAAALVTVLTDVGITCRAIELGLDEKNDLADWCKLYGGDFARLEALPDAIAPNARIGSTLGAQRVAQPQYHNTHDDLYPRWVNEVVKPALDATAPIIKPYKQDGYRFSPLRAENNPSFRVSYEKIPLGVPMDATGKVEGGWTTVASAVGAGDFKTWLREQGLMKSKSPRRDGRAVKSGRGMIHQDTTPDPTPTHSPIMNLFPTPDVQLSSRYIAPDELADLINAYRTVALRSAMGTGKTHAMAAVIRRYRDTGKRVLVITHRIPLARQISQATELPCYLNHDGLLGHHNGLVISLDSIARVSNAKPYDLVVVDEIEQLQQHIRSTTFERELGGADTAYRTLRAITRGAGHFVGMSATLNSPAVMWLKEQRGACTVIHNTYQPPECERHTVELVYGSDGHNPFSGVMKDVLATIKRGEKVALSSDSRNQTTHIQTLIGRAYPSVRTLLLNAHTIHTHEAAGLETLNTALQDVDVLIYSPTLGTGFSIDVPFDLVVHVGQGKHLTIPDHIQQLGRVRHARRHLLLLNKSSGGWETDADTIRSRRRRMADYSAHMTHRAGYDPVTLEINALIAAHEADNNIGRNASHATAAAILTDMGYRVVNRVYQADSGVKQQWNDACTHNKQVTKQRTLTANALDIGTFQQLREKHALTPDHYSGLNRWMIEDITGSPLTAALYDALHSPNQRAKVKRAVDVLYATQAELLERDAQEIDTRTLLSIRKHHFFAAGMILKIIEAVWGRATMDALRHGKALPQDFVSANQIRDALKLLLDQPDCMDILHYCYGYRDDHHAALDNPSGLLRFLLERVGFKLKSEQKRLKNSRERIMRYTLQIPAEYLDLCRQVHERNKVKSGSMDVSALDYVPGEEKHSSRMIVQISPDIAQSPSDDPPTR